MEIFEQKLKELIRTKQKMQIDICKDLNITKQKLTNWKTGYTEPNLSDLAMLAKYFDVSTDYMLGLEDESGRKIYNINNDIHHNRVVNINQR